MNIALAVLTTILCLCFLLLLLRIKSRSHKDIVNRMEYFSGNAVQLRQQQLRGKTSKMVRGHFRAAVRKVALKLQAVQRENRMDFRMQQADWPMLGSEFEVILALFGLISGLIALAATLSPWIGLVAGLSAIMVGLLFLSFYIKRRQKAFTNQLGDMLTMVANALRAGFGFMQAFELIAKEMDAPIGREVQKVVNEVNVGATLETALENMQKRVQSSDFELVITAVLIQKQVGGNLAQILDTISYTINERIRMRREVLSLTAQGRLSGVVVALLPFGVAAVLTFINPEYLKPLIEVDIGKYIVAAAVVSEAIGMFLIQRIVDIKF